MYSSHAHICQLAALLKAHGVRDGVFCPGSRNAPLTHTLVGAGIKAVGVTDERCAAFAAIGMSLALQCRPVLVCVTSGTAVLNTMPAVAEAAERGLPLLIVSADRPAPRIGQLMGQTLTQQGVMRPFAQTYNIKEAHTEDEHRHNNQLINEALNSLQRGPVHINVPIDEPLYDFTTPTLPTERFVSDVTPIAADPIPVSVISEIRDATYPIIVCGQWERGGLDAAVRLHEENRALLLPDFLSGLPGSSYLQAASLLQAIVPAQQAIVHLGGNFTFPPTALRQLQDAFTVRIEEQSGRTPDTFHSLRHVVRCSPQAALAQLLRELPSNPAVCRVRRHLESIVANHSFPAPAPALGNCYEGLYRTMLQCRPASLHLSNSLAVRLAAHYMPSGLVPTFCNRGVNGIEGSMSVAWGYSQRAAGPTLFVTGDLSFFYDSNALWNDAPADLRILLINDGGGMILREMDGVKQIEAQRLVCGSHNTNAQGLCKSFGIEYRCADEGTYYPGSKFTDFAHVELQWLLEPTTDPAPRPRLLEVFPQIPTQYK